MAQLYLTQSVCDKASPRSKRYDLRDTFVRGLFLRVEVSGRKTWYNFRIACKSCHGTQDRQRIFGEIVSGRGRPRHSYES